MEYRKSRKACLRPSNGGISRFPGGSLRKFLSFQFHLVGLLRCCCGVCFGGQVRKSRQFLCLASPHQSARYDQAHHQARMLLSLLLWLMLSSSCGQSESQLSPSSHAPATAVQSFNQNGKSPSIHFKMKIYCTNRWQCQESDEAKNLKTTTTTTCIIYFITDGWMYGKGRQAT